MRTLFCAMATRYAANSSDGRIGRALSRTRNKEFQTSWTKSNESNLDRNLSFSTRGPPGGSLRHIGRPDPRRHLRILLERGVRGHGSRCRFPPSDVDSWIWPIKGRLARSLHGDRVPFRLHHIKQAGHSPEGVYPRRGVSRATGLQLSWYQEDSLLQIAHWNTCAFLVFWQLTRRAIHSDSHHRARKEENHAAGSGTIDT